MDIYQKRRDEIVPVGSKFGKWTVIDNKSTKKSKGVLSRCVCGKEKKVYIADLIEGRSTQCLKCSRNEVAYQAKRRDTFKLKSEFKSGDKYGLWTVLTPLIKGNYVQCQCECGTVRSLQNSNLKSGSTLSCGCVTYQTSKAEGELQSFLDSIGVSANKEKIDGVEVDLLAPKEKIAIEYNGLYWHSEEFGRGSKYHLKKTEHCRANGIRLIHIREDLWNTRKNQVQSFLRSSFGKNENKIYARKCKVVSIDKMEAGSFLDDVHIQGRDRRASICLGLYCKGELVSVCTISKHHRNNKEWVLSRFASKHNHTVVGGLSRLTKHAMNVIDTGALITWADRSLSEGSGYISAGWELEGILRPDYAYVKGNKVVSKQSRKKSNVGTPEGMTEREHAVNDGLYRIWDCGKLKLTFKGN